MKEKNAGDKSKLLQTDAEMLIAFYFHVWNTHLHIKRLFYLKAMCGVPKMSSVASRKGNKNRNCVL